MLFFVCDSCGKFSVGSKAANGCSMREPIYVMNACIHASTPRPHFVFGSFHKSRTVENNDSGQFKQICYAFQTMFRKWGMSLLQKLSQNTSLNPPQEPPTTYHMTLAVG